MTRGFIEGKWLPFHLGHYHAILRASEQVDELIVVLGSNDKLDAEKCRQSGCKEMPAELRLSWLGNTFKDWPNIKVVHIKYEGNEDDWMTGAMVDTHVAALGKFTHVFSSETRYDAVFKTIYPWAKSVLIDPKRSFYNISGTEIRADPFKHWDTMLPIVRSHFVKKVLITGVESVGKSTMVATLRRWFNTIGIQEVGRDYSVKYNNFLTAEMFDDIAMKHYLLQKEALERCTKYLFVDSDAIVTQYYLGKYLNIRSHFIDQLIKLQDYDYTFWLAPTVKWVDDGYRFLESTREADNKYLSSQYEGYYLVDDSNYHQRLRQILDVLI